MKGQRVGNTTLKKTKKKTPTFWGDKWGNHHPSRGWKLELSAQKRTEGRLPALVKMEWRPSAFRNMDIGFHNF